MLMLRADGKHCPVRHRVSKKKLLTVIAAGLLVLSAAAVMCACGDTNVSGSGTEKGNTEMEKRKHMTLVGAEYDTVNGPACLEATHPYMELYNERLLDRFCFLHRYRGYLRLSNYPCDADDPQG